VPTCPKCKSEIDELICWAVGKRKYIFTAYDGVPNYEDWHEFRDTNQNTYECPECNEVLFKREEEAIDFLKE